MIGCWSFHTALLQRARRRHCLDVVETSVTSPPQPPTMAYMFLKKEIVCSLCSDIYTDPVMLHCGHNFCSDCIKIYIGHQGRSSLYPCPECKQTSKNKAPLTINTKLQSIAQHWKTVENRYRLGDASCTYCLKNPSPAVKFCLHCESSLCEKHLEVHSKTWEHSLADVTTPLQSRICTVHGEILKFFCLEDKTLICMLCFLNGTHQRHGVELLEVASHHRKEELRETADHMHVELDGLKKSIIALQEVMKGNLEEADVVKGEIRMVCSGLLSFVRHVASKMEASMELQELEAFKEMMEEIASLDNKAEQLSREIKHVEDMCNQDDPVLVLQDKTLCKLRSKRLKMDLAGQSVPDSEFDFLLLSLKLKDSLKSFARLVPNLLSTQCLHLKYKANVLLNSKSASEYLRVAPDQKTVEYTGFKTERNRGRPGRFKTSHVLSMTAFSSGKHYWEVKGGQDGIKSVGVAYPSIKKDGLDAFIGYNEKSWCLTWSCGYVVACHNSKCSRIASAGPALASVAVYLDYEAGRLSFYRICSTIEHLFTFSAEFTEPLHAALYLVDGWMKIYP